MAFSDNEEPWCPQVDEEKQDVNHKPKNKINFNEIGSRILLKYKNDLLETLVKSACLWIPFTTVNFLLVPANFRVVATSFIAVGWNCILSLIQHRDVTSESNIGK